MPKGFRPRPSRLRHENPSYRDIRPLLCHYCPHRHIATHRCCLCGRLHRPSAMPFRPIRPWILLSIVCVPRSHGMRVCMSEHAVVQCGVESRCAVWRRMPWRGVAWRRLALRRVVWRRAMLCCAVPCRAVPCCAVPCRLMLWRVMACARTRACTRACAMHAFGACACVRECVHVHAYACVCACVRACVRAGRQAGKRACIWTSMHVSGMHMHVCAHRVYACVHACVYVCVCVSKVPVHACVCACAFMHALECVRRAASSPVSVAWTHANSRILYVCAFSALHARVCMPVRLPACACARACTYACVHACTCWMITVSLRICEDDCRYE